MQHKFLFYGFINIFTWPYLAAATAIKKLNVSQRKQHKIDNLVQTSSFLLIALKKYTTISQSFNCQIKIKQLKKNKISNTGRWKT